MGVGFDAGVAACSAPCPALPVPAKAWPLGVLVLEGAVVGLLVAEVEVSEGFEDALAAPPWASCPLPEVGVPLALLDDAFAEPDAVLAEPAGGADAAPSAVLPSDAAPGTTVPAAGPARTRDGRPVAEGGPDATATPGIPRPPASPAEPGRRRRPDASPGPVNGSPSACSACGRRRVCAGVAQGGRLSLRGLQGGCDRGARDGDAEGREHDETAVAATAPRLCRPGWLMGASTWRATESSREPSSSSQSSRAPTRSRSRSSASTLLSRVGVTRPPPARRRAAPAAG